MAAFGRRERRSRRLVSGERKEQAGAADLFRCIEASPRVPENTGKAVRGGEAPPRLPGSALRHRRFGGRGQAGAGRQKALPFQGESRVRLLFRAAERKVGYLRRQTRKASCTPASSVSGRELRYYFSCIRLAVTSANSRLKRLSCSCRSSGGWKAKMREKSVRLL